MDEDTKECVHDWRVDPFRFETTLPVRVRLVCIKCNGERTAPFHFKPKVNRKNDPTTWKKYTGELD